MRMGTALVVTTVSNCVTVQSVGLSRFSYFPFPDDFIVITSFVFRTGLEEHSEGRDLNNSGFIFIDLGAFVQNHSILTVKGNHLISNIHKKSQICK